MTPDKQILKNKVREVCDRRGIDREQFIGICLQSPAKINGKKLTYDTAGRAYDGETTISLTTAALVASALKVSLSEVFDVQ